jgi:hypothetical protein
MRKNKVKGARETFLLIGFIPMMPSGPSLGTPVFRSANEDGEFIQYSKKEKSIEALVKLPFVVSNQNSFVRIRPNNTFQRSDEFLIGFKDARDAPNVYTKSALLSKISSEFSEYDDHPFLQWNLINCFGDHDLISKLSDKVIEVIFRAIIGGEAFFKVSRDSRHAQIIIRVNDNKHPNFSYSDVERHFEKLPGIGLGKSRMIGVGRKGKTALFHTDLKPGNIVFDFGDTVTRKSYRRVVRSLQEQVLGSILRHGQSKKIRRQRAKHNNELRT